MKRWCLMAALIPLMAASVLAQTPLNTVRTGIVAFAMRFTADSNQTVGLGVNGAAGNIGATVHEVSYNTFSASSVSVTVTASTDNGATFGAPTACVRSSDSASSCVSTATGGDTFRFDGAYTVIKVTVTKTGSGSSVEATYSGNSAVASSGGGSGSVTECGTQGVDDIAFFSGATEICGSTALTYTTATNVITATGTALITGLVSGARFVPTGSTVPTNGLYLPAANTLGLAVNSGAELQLTASALSPAADDGSALGTSSLGFADLFLAPGGTINLDGATSGTTTIVPAATGTWTLTLPANDGDANQVLTTDGSGVTSWTTPAGSGTITGGGTATQLAFFSGASAITSSSGLTTSGGTLVSTVASGTTGQIMSFGTTQRKVFLTSVTGNESALTINSQPTELETASRLRFMLNSASSGYVGTPGAGVFGVAVYGGDNVQIITDPNGTIKLQPGGSTTLTFSQTATISVVPAADNTQFLGTASARFNTVSSVNYDSGASAMGLTANSGASSVNITAKLNVSGAAVFSAGVSSGGVNYMSGLTAASGTPDAMCRATLTKEVTFNSGVTTCIVSDEEQKTTLVPMAGGLDLVRKMQPSVFEYLAAPERERFGFGAQSLQRIDSRLADGYDKNGIARSIDIAGILAANTKAIQELDAKVQALERRQTLPGPEIN